MMEVKEITTPLYESRNWMRFLAVMLIVGGAFTAFSIIGIAVFWVPVWAGIMLFQAANNAGKVRGGEDDAMALRTALAKLKTYFILSGVLMIVYFALAVGYAVWDIFWD